MTNKTTRSLAPGEGIDGFARFLEGTDPEVGVEAVMTVEKLVDDLGFDHNSPNMYHLGDQAKQTIVHAILQNISFPTARDSNSTGVLCADEVGLGKATRIRCIAAMATMMDVVTHQAEGLPPPPLVGTNSLIPSIVTHSLLTEPAGSRAFITQHNPLPSLPILVVVPGTLLPRWEAELRMAVKHRCADLMVYGSGLAKHKEFWSSSGIYASSQHPEHRRIILASHSAILEDYGLLYSSSQSKGYEKPGSPFPWDSETAILRRDPNTLGTLFSKTYLATIVDQSHQFRGAGPRHSAVLQILDQSLVPMSCTTSPQPDPSLPPSSPNHVQRSCDIALGSGRPEEAASNKSVTCPNQERQQGFKAFHTRSLDHPNPFASANIELDYPHETNSPDSHRIVYPSEQLSYGPLHPPQGRTFGRLSNPPPPTKEPEVRDSYRLLRCGNIGPIFSKHYPTDNLPDVVPYAFAMARQGVACSSSAAKSVTQPSTGTASRYRETCISSPRVGCSRALHPPANIPQKGARPFSRHRQQDENLRRL
ncbi:hypothetical protein NMY22_g500 [Coprinellus aureogranulatus]|nr:hypothetical protein NMY22_g500 [Coprinellus aureogranulatus]